MGFKERDVEYWMDETKRPRKFKPEGMGGDDSGDGEGTQTFVIKLLGWPLSCDILSIEPYKVANLELWRYLSAAIGRNLVLTLGDGDLLSAVFVELREGLREVVGCWIADSHVQGECCPRIVTIVGKERRDLSSGVSGIVVSELRYGKEIGPIVLLVVGIHAEICLHSLIGTLRLTVGLRVKSCRIVELNVQQPA